MNIKADFFVQLMCRGAVFGEFSYDADLAERCWHNDYENTQKTTQMFYFERYEITRNRYDVNTQTEITNFTFGNIFWKVGSREKSSTSHVYLFSAVFTMVLHGKLFWQC